MGYLAFIIFIVGVSVTISVLSFGRLIKGLRRFSRHTDRWRSEDSVKTDLVKSLGQAGNGLADLLTLAAVVTSIAIIAGIIAGLNGLFG